MSETQTNSAALQYISLLQRSERDFRDPAYRPEQIPSFDPLQAEVKLFAYYLPQFHPIPENDKWWGKGFTEWTNVTRAAAQFPGHYQPRLPADLGFYDLRNEETLEQQVALAKAYGISGFCMYYYWFNGHRLLQRPLDTLVRRKDLDFQFCLCWANENWTRRWDGGEADILMAQTHSPESDARFIEDILQYMQDPRYLEIDGRPVLIVYRVPILPTPRETAERWRHIARERLGKDLFLIYAMTFGNEEHPTVFGFDAAVEFPPHRMPLPNVADRMRPFSPDYKGAVYDYQGLHKGVRALHEFNFPVIPAVFPNWDNTPRRGLRSSCFTGSNPDLYSRWLAEAEYYAVQKPVFGRSYVFINAWNEWAEGAYLEPDQKYGHAYLRATAETLRPYAPAPSRTNGTNWLAPTTSILPAHSTPRSKTGIVIHAFYPDVLEDLFKRLPDSKGQDVFISVVEDSAPELLPIIARYAENARIYFFPNRGRDVRPFLFILRTLKELGYESFVKLHTKKSLHRQDGQLWYESLTAPLLELCRPGCLRSVLDQHPTVGIIGPAGQLLDGSSYMGSAGNMAWLTRLCREFGVEPLPSAFTFVAGTMFAGRMASFAQITQYEALGALFEEEQGRLDGTLAHALERFFGLLMAHRGEAIASAAFVAGRLIIDESGSCAAEYPFANAHVGMLNNPSPQMQPT
jgi:lipopolysaccharide biosynthesis protein